jgi:hypothetical protein
LKLCLLAVHVLLKLFRVHCQGSTFFTLVCLLEKRNGPPESASQDSLLNFSFSLLRNFGGIKAGQDEPSSTHTRRTWTNTSIINLGYIFTSPIN